MFGDTVIILLWSIICCCPFSFFFLIFFLSFGFCRRFNVTVETYTTSIGVVHAGLLNGTSCKRLVSAFGSGTCSLGCNGGAVTNIEDSTDGDSSENGDNVNTTTTDNSDDSGDSDNTDSPDNSDSNSGARSLQAKISSLSHFTSRLLQLLFVYIL